MMAFKADPVSISNIDIRDHSQSITLYWRAEASNCSVTTFTRHSGQAREEFLRLEARNAAELINGGPKKTTSLHPPRWFAGRLEENVVPGVNYRCKGAALTLSFE